MSRCGFHTFVSTAPVFGAEEDYLDPMFEPADRAAVPRPPPGRAAEARCDAALARRAPDTIQQERLP